MWSLFSKNGEKQKIYSLHFEKKHTPAASPFFSFAFPVVRVEYVNFLFPSSKSIQSAA